MSGAPARVALVGAGGRMGCYARALLEEAGHELVALVGRGDDLSAALAAARPEVGVDFTIAGLGFSHARAMLLAGVRPLVGTSGVSAEETGELDRLARARALGGLVVPNFCLGIWLQQELAARIARHFPAVEIVEEHHAAKRDAPSGTALATAERLGELLDRPPATIPIHALRLPGLGSSQTLVFGNEGEVLRLRHETQGLSAFGPGILCALEHVRTAAGVGRGLGAALEARSARA